MARQNARDKGLLDRLIFRFSTHSTSRKDESYIAPAGIESALAALETCVPSHTDLRGGPIVILTSRQARLRRVGPNLMIGQLPDPEISLLHFSKDNNNIV